MKKYSYTFSILLCLSATLWAQNPRSPLSAKNGADLEQILRDNFEAQQRRILEKAKTLNYPAKVDMPDGTTREFVALSPTGMPIYVHNNNNLDAAKTISTNKVWPGGANGTSLSGINMTNRLAVWDGGGVRTTHQEFQGRATQTDGSPSLSDHATHVAGTMCAGGVVSNAKGMSYQAPIKCYDWNSDESEMASAAAAGLLVSNHSYSQISGWQYNSSLNRWEFWGDPSVSVTEDYKYGFYDGISQNWDQILVTYPNYLPFVAAGNDRGEPGTIPSTFYIRNTSGNWVLGNSSNPPTVIGPYDCISGGPSNAKNVLTVGAVNKITTGWTKASDVVMSSFSGWGPTDDGRIKPDVVANGVSVYSSISTSNSAYATLNGTSMATPNASGSALLIQQHYFNLKNTYMRSSTLKGLIIHTADEAGSNVGPDYSFGWGLMNTSKAVSTISDTLKSAIIQNSYSSGGTFTYTFFSDGTTPIRATICWTDRPGNSPGPSIDPSNKMLVNDLDLRIRKNADNSLVYPYVLNKSNPSAAATTGDNSVDNVEQVYIAAPSAGTYTIVINGKGTMVGGSQPYALIITGITPKPTAGFTTASTVVCAGRSLTFTDQSSGATSRMWYFPGAVPATSTATNPTVSYAVPGVYPVALRISSATGYDSIYKDDYITVGGLPLPVIETFEPNSPTRNLWTVENPNGDSTFRPWTIGGNTPGNTAMGINNYDWPTNYLLDRLLSPVIDLRGYQTAKLDFQHAYTRYDNSPSDSIIVYISTNCGTNYTRLAAYGESGTGGLATAPDATFMSSNRFEPATAEDWCGGAVGAPCISVNLNAYVGFQNVRIRIEQKSQSGNNMFIDNISITGTPNAPVANFYSLTKTVCVGDEVQMLDSSLNKPTTYSWLFTDADTATSTIRNPKVRFTSAGTKAISLLVTNANGRDSITKTAYINVLPSPAAPVISSSKGLVLCDGDSTTISSNVSSNYIWYKNGLVYSTSLLSFQNKEEASFYQKVVGANGCTAKSDIMSIGTGTTPAKPSITKDLTGTVFCEGGSFNLFSSSLVNNQWMINDTIFTGKTGTTLNYNDAGKFNLRVYDKGCFNTSDSLVITKLPRPQTSEINGHNWGVKGDTASFSVIPGASGSAFNWTVSGATIQSGANTPNVQVKFSTGTASTLSVQETGTNGCKSSVKTISVSLVNTGISQHKSAEWKVYPNPSSSYLRIEGDWVKDGFQNLQVYNVLGQPVFTLPSNGLAPGSNYIEIDTKNFQPGLYILKVKTQTLELNKTFIKE